MTIYVVFAITALIALVGIGAAVRTALIDGYHRQPVRTSSH